MKPGVPTGRKPTEGPQKKREDFGDRVKAHIRYYFETGETAPDGTAIKQYVPGVTTILNELPSPWLVGWANRLGLEGIDQRKYTDAAARVGTLAHDLVERQLDGNEYSLREWSEDEQERATYSVNAFLAWRKGKELQPILVEKPLVSRTLKYGGKLDYYGYIDGLRTLLDFKTSTKIGLDHRCQVTAYDNLLIENGYEPPEQRILLRLGRNEELLIAEQENLKPERMPRYWQIFLNCLSTYYIKKELKEQ